MSGIIRDCALGLCAVSLLTAAAQALVGKGKYADLLRLIGAVASALVLLAPLKGAFSAIREDLGAVRAPVSDAAGQDAVHEQARRLLERQVGEYAAACAHDRGMDCTASAQYAYTDGSFRLISLRLAYAREAPEADRAALRRYLASALGAEEACITEGRGHGGE